ncbi:hypothetical protein M407DRAFT_7393 [Tulasnella calospora MUT 4182]|uniref:Uncharacterized protein n=1 Tax=Tulasnella calospora MUT 4182 TaxID=1051891 RepID=A0A0C3QAF1_9AGAM|nr:hypothetical protein M407DRAFT_7393 [Tulasnella calospora MUT 4182]
MSRYVPPIEDAMGQYISRASNDSELAEELCSVSELSRSDLESELLRVKELQRQLRENKSEKGLPVLESSYLELRAKKLKQAIDRAPRSRGVTNRGLLGSQVSPGTLSNSPILRIMEILISLRRPFDVTRGEIGVTLRELHRLVEADLLPQPHHERLGAILNEFEGVITYYPDDSHQKVVGFLIRSIYEDYLQHGECGVRPRLFTQLVERWRGLYDVDEDTLELLPHALAAEIAFSEMPLHEPKAKVILERAIEVCRRPFMEPGHKELSRRLLATTLVRLSQCLRREDCGQNSNTGLDGLRDAVDMFDDLAQSETSAAKGGVVGEGLMEALDDLALVLRRGGEIKEAMKVEAKLTQLQKRLNLGGSNRKT